MNWRIETTSDFDREVKRLSKKYRSLVSDLRQFQKDIKENPHMGTEIIPKVRKIRIAITSKGKGKSGGARIITYVSLTDTINGIIYLLSIYDKSESSSIREDYLINLIKEYNL